MTQGAGDGNGDERRLLELVLAGDAYARERLMEMWMRRGVAPFQRVVDEHCKAANWSVYTPCVTADGDACLRSTLSPTLHRWDREKGGDWVDGNVGWIEKENGDVIPYMYNRDAVMAALGCTDPKAERQAKRIAESQERLLKDAQARGRPMTAEDAAFIAGMAVGISDGMFGE